MREKTVYTLGLIGSLILLYNLFTVFMVLPDEAMQGAIYRILFIHVPAAFAAWILYTVALVGSVMFLVKKDFAYDSMATSCIEVATMFTLVNLVTGSIWGRVMWGIWWAWDVRLTSQLICFLLYLGYLLLRPAVNEPTQRATMSAILSIFAFVDIPIVFMAIRWHDARTQHPAPVLETGGLAPEFKGPFWLGVLSFILISGAMVLVRLHQENTRREMDSVRREVHAL